MKVFTALFILCGTYSTHSASVGVSESNQCDNQQNGALLPISGECSQFYICLDGEAYLNDCGSQLHFDPISNTCIEASRSLCVQGQPLADLEPKPYKPVLSKNICLEKATGAFVPSKTNCNEYYVCVNSKALVKKCQQGFHFSPDSRSCIAAELSNCVIKLEENNVVEKSELVASAETTKEKITEEKPKLVAETVKKPEIEEKPELAIETVKETLNKVKPQLTTEQVKETNIQEEKLQLATETVNESNTKEKPKLVAETVKKPEIEEKPELAIETVKETLNKVKPQLTTEQVKETNIQEEKLQLATETVKESNTKEKPKLVAETVKKPEIEEKPELAIETVKETLNKVKPQLTTEQVKETNIQEEKLQLATETVKESNTKEKPKLVAETVKKPEIEEKPELAIETVKETLNIVKPQLTTEQVKETNIQEEKLQLATETVKELNTKVEPQLVAETVKTETVKESNTKEKPQSNNPIETTISRQTVCLDQPDGAMFPAPGSCSKYFACLQSKAFEQSCGLRHFNPSDGNCINIDSSSCVEEKTELTDNLDIAVAVKASDTEKVLATENIIQIDENDIVNKDLGSLNTYAISEGKLIGNNRTITVKQSGLPIKENVVSNVISADVAAKKENFEIVLAIVDEASSDACVGISSGTLLSRIGNCQEFITCENGVAFVGECPRGLHFNPEGKFCDWPEFAGCA